MTEELTGRRIVVPETRELGQLPLQNMQDAADHTPIVDAPGARLIGR
jgi:hypothetical protein